MADQEANGNRALLRWLGRGAGALLALVTLTTAVVGLLFTFVPGLKPEPEPIERSAAIAQVTVEPGATLGSYLAQIRQLNFTRRQFGNQKDAAADLFRTPCISVYAQVRITGFESVRKRLTMNLYDAARGLPLTGFAYRQETGGSVSPGFRRFRAAQGLDFAPRSDSDQYVGRTCIVSDAGEPPPAGRYFVRVELEDEDGRLLTYRDTESFEFLPTR